MDVNMKFLIGLLLGVTICFAVLAIFTVYENPLEEGEQTLPKDIEIVNKSATLENETSKIFFSANNELLEQEEIKSKLYTWLDSNGNKVVSDVPPATGTYQMYEPDSAVSVVEYKVPKLEKRIEEKRQAQLKRVTSTVDNSKTAIISRNHTHCRWFVGRAKDAYDKILSNKSSRKSIWCDEHEKWMKEMRKLAREGDGCSYPHSTPSSCYR